MARFNERGNVEFTSDVYPGITRFEVETITPDAHRLIAYWRGWVPDEETIAMIVEYPSRRALWDHFQDFDLTPLMGV